MKKAIVLISFIIIVVVSTASFAEATDYYDFNELNSELSESLFDSMDENTIKFFENLGINNLDFEKLYKVSFKSLITYFTPELKDRIKDIFSAFFELFSVVLMLSLFNALTDGSSINKSLMLFGSAVVILMGFANISDVINSCLSALKLSSTFMISYIPVFTLIISFSGNPAGALVYNSFVLGFAEFISVIISSGLVEFIGCFLCLAISFSFNEVLNTNRLIGVTNKTVNLILGISGSLFSSMLTIKNVLAVSLDSVSLRGIRLILSSFIPVIGSSISEAYSSILGSINLIKGSVAVIGILAVVIINLPVIIEALLYYISFSALSYISEITGCNRVSDLFKAICCAVRILLLFVVFEMFLLIISTGIILAFRS